MKQKNRALIVGGSNGIGLAIAICLAKEQPILIVDKVEPDYDKISVHVRPFITFQRFDLLSDDYALFDEFSDIDTLGEFYQFNLSSCIRQQNSLTAQFVSFSLSNLANIFYPPPIFTIINLCLL